MNILNRLLIWLLTINCVTAICITAVGTAAALVNFVGSDFGFSVITYLVLTSCGSFAWLVKQGVL